MALREVVQSSDKLITIVTHQLEGSSSLKAAESRSDVIGFQGEVEDGERDQQAEWVYPVLAAQEFAQEAQNPPTLCLSEQQSVQIPSNVACPLLAAILLTHVVFFGLGLVGAPRAQDERNRRARAPKSTARPADPFITHPDAQPNALDSAREIVPSLTRRARREARPGPR